MGNIIIKILDYNRARLFINTIKRYYLYIQIDQNDDLLYISTESNTVNNVIHFAMAYDLQVLSSIYRV